MSLAAIAYHLSKLTELLESMSRGGDDDSRTPVKISDSIGSCPNCNSTDIKQEGDLPKAIYYCKACNITWINNAFDFFSS